MPTTIEKRGLAHRTFLGHGGWWGRVDKAGWYMERGPYRFRWMAQLSFPIIRLMPSLWA
jgi:hypothetical protein